MILWRIAAETRLYKADDLSGLGAAKHPGRWNELGQPVVYCATTRALAALETAAHLDDAGLPLNRYLVRIAVPDSVWDARLSTAADALPVGWDAIPAGIASIAFGSRWLQRGESAVLELPSVIVPDETVALLNPSHPDAKRITATADRRFDYNRLFRGAG